MKEFIDQEIPISLSSAANVMELKCTVSSELMEYTLPGVLLDSSPDYPVNAMQDDAGNPIIFTVMKDLQLYAILRINDMQTGWLAVNLTANSKRGNVNTYTVSQSQKGIITLAVAFKKQDTYSLLVSHPLNNKVANTTQWKNIEWCDHTDVPPHIIGKLYLGMDDGDGSPLMIVTTNDRQGSDYAEHYIVETGSPTIYPKPWELFPIPNNALEIVDIAVGRHSLFGRGIYNLYKTDGGMSLQFISLKDKYRKTHNIDLPVPQNAKTIDALPTGTNGNTDLYIGGNGIYLLPNKYHFSKYKDPKYFTVLAMPEKAPDVQKIIARDDSQNLSVWALDQKNQLYYVKGSKQTEYDLFDCDTDLALPEDSSVGHSDWDDALIIRQKVVQLAPIRNFRLSANDVLLKADGKFVKFMQSPDTQLWHSSDIPLPDDGKVQEVNAYVTQLTITKTDGSPYLPDLEERMEQATAGMDELKPKLKFRMTASDLVQVEVNGKSYMVGSTDDKAIDVFPDSRGSITLIAKTTGLESPFFYLNRDACATIVVNPAHKVHEDLKNIKSAEYLKSVTLRDGKPLVDPVYHDRLEDAVSGLNNFNRVAGDLPQTGGISSVYLPVQMADLPDWTGAFGMSFSPEKGLCHFSGHEAFQMMKQAIARDMPQSMLRDNWIWDAIKRVAGDVLEWAKNAVVEAFEFVVHQVGQAWEFALKIGNEIFKFTIQCLTHLYSAVNWLLKKTLGIDLDKLIEWLGFVFDWDDIKATKQVFSSVINYTIEFGEKQIKKTEKQVDDFFVSIIKALKDKDNRKKMIESLQRARVHGGLLQAGQNQQTEAPDKSRKALEFVTKSPAGNLSNFALSHSGLYSPQMSGFSLTAETAICNNDIIKDFFEKTVIPSINRIEKDVEKLGGDFKLLFEGNDENSIEKALEMLATDTVVAILTVIKEIIKGILILADEFVRAIKDILNEEFNLPFISALYKKITGSEKMTLLDIFSLVFAIPATIVYKLLKGSAPFPKNGGKIPEMTCDTYFNSLQAYGTGAFGSDRNDVDPLKILSWIAGVASGGLAYMQAIISLGYAMVEKKIPAALFTPISIFQIALSAPYGGFTFINIAGWIPKWMSLCMNMIDIVFPGEKAGHITRIVIAILQGGVNSAKNIYTIVTDADKPVILGYAIFKLVEDGVFCLSSIVSGVGGLLPASTPYGGKYITLVLGATGQTFRSELMIVRAGATILTDNLMVNS